MSVPPRPTLPMPEPHFVDSTDSVSLAVYDFGGDGPDVLFAHATGFCAGVFLPLIEQLPAGRFVALDFRGHGLSSRPNSSMAWSGTAQDVIRCVEHMGLERPFGVGHSMGGAALTLAQQERPDLMRGLWLFEPIVFPPDLRRSMGDNPLAAGALRRRSSFPDASAAYENFASKPPLDALAPEALWAYVTHGFASQPDGSIELLCCPETESETYQMGIQHDAFDHLSEVDVPVRVLRGRDEAMTPAAMAPLIAEGFADGTLEEHPELGHFGPLEDPASMAASVAAAVTASS